MPYHKDKQQAFQAAQQGTMEAKEWYENLVHDRADYGSQLKHLKQEVNEAFEQINNALEVASETQRAQLEQFRSDLEAIVSEVNQTE
ncbi:phenylalanyl-tRNA synthetase alpha subunit [Anoxybacillus calidus]|uniref:Phenylalanyl-tRNA synthetase alpha subunit n=1 Tax=[Anoxybacillus] calidus TaxID=575178 RepID=A0A7V9YZ37_9BACL|nr:phenylalanyl-tRNA synthetase alpha subunit [Anoxybacillus calidus]